MSLLLDHVVLVRFNCALNNCIHVKLYSAELYNINVKLREIQVDTNFQRTIKR